MKKDEFKKKIKKYSKDEIIEALTNTFFISDKYDYIIQSARDIKFKKLMKESESIHEKMMKLIIKPDDDSKTKLIKLSEYRKLIVEDENIQKEIDKILKSY